MVEPFANATAASRAVLVDVLGVLGGYRSHLVVIHQHGATNIFQKSVGVGNAQMVVRVDLIGGEYGVSDERNQSQRVQEMHVAALRGVDLALDWYDEVRISGARADAARDVVTAQVASIEAFICMKALAMGDRRKAKDAFDIYFCLRQGGTEETAVNLSRFRSNGLVQEALRHLTDKFASIDHVGPVDAAAVAADNGEDSEQARRAAFELTRMLLERVQS